MTKRILITGCSTGIGRSLAEELTQRGYHVIATARDASSLVSLNAAMRLPLDVTSDTSVHAAVAEAGHIDVLINNAGIGLWGAAEATDLADVSAVFDTNVIGMLRVTRAVLPQMRARRAGLVVQVSSAVGRISGPLVGIYAASKHALEALSEALRIELHPFGVDITIAEPGAVISAFPQNRLSADAPDYAELTERVRTSLMALRKEPSTSAYVAQQIVQIIETQSPALRYTVTPDAAAMIAHRLSQTDSEWEAEQLHSLGFRS